MGLAQSASITAAERERSLPMEELGTEKAGSDRQKFVLFAGTGGSRMALPLAMLARLEELPGSGVERSGNQWVTQYRGQILPLIRISPRTRGAPGAAAAGTGGKFSAGGIHSGAGADA